MEKNIKTIECDFEFLKQKSIAVDFTDKEYLKDIEVMKEYCIDQECLAFAAVQLGIPKRIVYLRNTNVDDLFNKDIDEDRVLINPVVISKTGITTYWETCASCLDYMGFVRRPYLLKIEYQDQNGKKHQATFEGFEATVLSHEIDHLDGILHIDIAKQVISMPEDERKIFRRKHGYQILSETGDYDELDKLDEIPFLRTIQFDEHFLRQVSKEVDFKDDSYLNDIKHLKNYCLNHQVYALAAVQIGIPKRMIYLKNTSESMEKNADKSYDEERVLINPVILERKGKTKFLERCASCIDYVGVVERPYSVKVSYYDILGKKKIEIFKGFEATVFCHEYDHLNGMLHIDIAEHPFECSLEETKKYRLEHPYEVIEKD